MSDGRQRDRERKGNPAPHLYQKEEAREFAEKVLKKEHGEIKTFSKNSQNSTSVVSSENKDIYSIKNFLNI